MRRKRKRRERAELPNPALPRDEQDHDVIVVPRRGVVEPWESFRLPVTKETDAESRRAGTFQSPPERWDLADTGQRRVLSTARPYETGEQAGEPQLRGPAFSTLPVKPEPASSYFGTCYLINVENLDNPNLWTLEEWNDGPGGPDYETPEHPNQFEVLIAGPRGKVFELEIRDLDAWDGGPAVEFEHGRGRIRQLDLRYEPEIWSQLRNGCIAGRARVGRGKAARVVPLVNVTALEPGLSRVRKVRDEP